MGTCDILLVSWVSCCVISCLLLVHHYYRHSRAGALFIANKFSRCFQRSDLCNFHTWNHETWVVAFWVCGLSCGIVQRLLLCDSGFTWFVLVYSFEFIVVAIVLVMQGHEIPAQNSVSETLVLWNS